MRRSISAVVVDVVVLWLLVRHGEVGGELGHLPAVVTGDGETSRETSRLDILLLIRGELVLLTAIARDLLC